MNPFAFELSSYTLKTFSGFSKAHIKISGQENIPDGSLIFTANHFTRIETIFLPYHIHNITGKKVWSLAADELFDVSYLQGFLNNLGAVSTKDPNRDELILKTLLSGNAEWIIFPEGMMVKNKKLVKNEQFTLNDDELVRSPHTGAAVTALRCEFYRERIRRMKQINPTEFELLIQRFELEDADAVLDRETFIVPVNITYYPAGPRENPLSKIAKILMKEPSKRVLDELMTEGAVLFRDVDINIRFGDPIPVKDYLNDAYIESMLTVKRRVRFEEDLSSKQIFKQYSKQIMEAYMAAVYRMTTLNYDHVMACVLKHLPYRENGVDPYEFRCKVYAAVSWLTSNKDFFVADNLRENQIHLLTDDRYHRIDTFLKTAADTGIVRIENDRIHKDQTRFVTKFDFHTIRIDNPVLVMANEVESVYEAEKGIKRISHQSESDILQAVKEKINEKIEVDFSYDYNTYYIVGESKKKRIGRPLFLKAEDEVAGVLLIHGYMAAPEEMKPFAQYLHRMGYTVSVPRLKGHGTAPEDLARTKYNQWIESVEEAFVALRHSSDTIIIGGFSTGAGLALELATRVDGISAAFAVAPPMRLKDLGAYFVPAIDTWNAMIKKIRLDAIAKEFVENRPENPHINYLRNPIAGIRQLEQLMDQLSPKLSSVTLPTLVVQSRKDPVVNPTGTLKLFEQLGSAVKEYYIFDYDRHGIMLGEGVERIYAAIDSFIRQWV